MPDSTQQDRLPISVICPVRNSMAKLPGHVSHLRTLAPLVEEIIVVDSQSTDGTTEYLHKSLAGMNVKFLNHPPGLYQSWNHGIAHARQPYLTVATVGDTLPHHSLSRLYETLVHLQADIVISAPVFIGDNGEPLPESKHRWPIHRFLEKSGLAEARKFSPAEWLTITLCFHPRTLIGSSAANLYRTALLQQHPMPDDCGHFGDAAWAMMMAGKASWAIDPKVEAYQWIHPPTHNRQGRTLEIKKTIQARSETLFLEAEPIMRMGGTPQRLIHEIQTSISTAREIELEILKQKYRSIRKPHLPWFLQANAARLRKAAKQIEQQEKAFIESGNAYFKECGSAPQTN